MGSARQTALQVEILCGPSGSGKTEHALRRYAEQVRREGEDTALLILPTARVVRQAREALVAGEGLPGLVDPRLFTFPQLAQAILTANHETATPISRTAQELLLREVIERQLADGKLIALAPVGRLPGFVRAALELIADLKRAAVEPTAFLAALKRAGLTQAWHREIAGLYSEYQSLLISLRYFDEEGLFWWARGVLARGDRRPLTQAKLMVVDGFTDFTTTQLEMLQLLANDIPQVLVTLDYSQDDGRENLAAWFGDTLERLRARLPGASVRELPQAAPSGALARLRAYLFSPPGLVPSLPSEGKVHVLECPSRSREVREVLRRIKSLLIQGEARPGDIAVIARSLPEYAPTVAELARRLGVPVHIEAPTPPTSSPAVQAVLRAYQVVAEGYRREDVLALLRSTYVTLLPHAAPPNGPSADDVALVAREAMVLEGRAQWPDRIAAHLKRVEARTADRLLDPGLIRALLATMPAIFTALPDPGGSMTLSDRVAETRRFLREACVWENVARGDLPEHASSDMRALALLEEGLDELEHSPAGAAPQEGLTVGEYLKLLTSLLGNRGDRPPPAGRDRVSVIDARSARELRFRTCFVMGLTEGEFPRRATEEPFFTRRELAALEHQGIDLEHRHSPEAEEPILFYAAASAATEELWLSYPATKADGRRTQPSHYLEEVRRLFCGPVDEEAVSVSQVVALSADCADGGELIDRAFFDLADREAPAPVAYDALLRLPGKAAKAPWIARGIAIEAGREGAQPPAAFVGVLSAPDILDDLRGRFGPEHRFSATALGRYAGCPFAFLCESVLGLTPVNRPEPAVDPKQAGSVRHRILAVLCRGRMARRPGEPLVAADGAQETLDELAAIIPREYARLAHQKGVAEPALWSLDEERCRADLRLWVALEAERFADQVPVGCEASFGRGESLVAIPGHDDVLLEGRIDRVNRVRTEGGVAFVVVDYKLGQGTSLAAVRAGRDPQFPIYVIGAPHALPDLAGRPCDSWYYWSVSGQVKLQPRKAVGSEVVRTVVEEVAPIIAGYAAGIRDGWFSTEGVEACAPYCAFRDVCRQSAWKKTREEEGAEAESDGA